MGFLVFLLISNFILVANAFNVDTVTRRSFEGTKGEYFGYSIALHQSGSEFWAVVGAPLGRDGKPNHGAVYKCNANKNVKCDKIPLDNGYSGSENKTSQWMGASVLSFGPNQEVVACAPRFKKLASGLWLHGRCAIINGKSFTRNNFWNPAADEIKVNRYQDFGYPLQGFSIAKGTSTRLHLITGMPGARTSGGAVGYQRLESINGLSRSRFGRSPADRLTRDEYMGYSVAWGQFSDIKERIYGDIVGGAPKGSNGRGKVLIYQMSGYMEIHSVIENPDPNSYSGSYFGASVCTVDLNADGKPDVLIGAPFSTVKEEDEGKVFVYLSDSKGAVNEVAQLAGEAISGRFGTTIASVGDLNKDGFPDVVIGAPYAGKNGKPGKGAIYIYHGSKDGIETQPVQKIYASDLAENPSAFGQSIAGELDIDGNSYPDIAVGSYESDHIHIFKSRAILKFKGTNKLNTTKVSISSKNVLPCKEFSGEKYQCVNLEFCLSYTGSSVPQNIDILAEIETDKGKKGGKRAIMIENGIQKSLISMTKNYLKGKNICENQVIYVTQSPKTLSSGITVNVNYKYSEPKGGCGGNVCPIGDYAKTGATSRVFQQEITYLRGCKSETKCFTDLVVDGKVEIPGGLTDIEYGVVDKIKLKIDVENKKENAFLSKMSIQYEDDFEPIGVKFINHQSPLWDRERVNNKNKLIFPLASPFAPKRKLQIEVSFSVSKQRPSAEKLPFVIEAVSDGSEETSPNDNKKIIELNTALRADLTVTGSAKPYKITYDQNPISRGKFTNETEIGAVVNYVFEVQNLGPAPVQGISARISLVTEHQNKYVAMLFVAQGEKSVRCNVTGKANPLNLTIDSTERNKNHPKAQANEVKGMTEINCRSGDCDTFDCYIGFLGKGSRQINLRTRIFQNTFIEEKRGLTKLTSTISITLDQQEKRYLRQPAGGKPDSIKVSVFVGPQIESKKGEQVKIDWWIILLAVLGGVFLIAVTVFVFYKLGFFKRKRVKDISGPNHDE